MTAQLDERYEKGFISAEAALDPEPQIRIVNIKKMIDNDKLTEKDIFKRTYLGHARMSSAFVFQGHKGPFKQHIHVTHDEIGIVLSGSGKVTVGGVTYAVNVGDLWIIPANIPHSGEFTEPTNVLFISSPQDHPVHQDRIWTQP